MSRNNKRHQILVDICYQGHVVYGDNARADSRGYTHCLTCDRIRQRAKRRRNNQLDTNRELAIPAAPHNEDRQ